MTHRKTLRLQVDVSTEEALEVDVLDEHRVRLLESPLASDPAMFSGDILEIRHEAADTYRVVRVLETPNRHHSWIVPSNWPSSDDAAAYFTSVAAAGGHHEILAGGVLFVHLPVETSFDASAELDRYLSSDWPDA